MLIWFGYCYNVYTRWAPTFLFCGDLRLTDLGTPCLHKMKEPGIQIRIDGL